ncbi:VOC family protein [Lutimaribacter sp. EGI FJ00015]|uniref:VOC family protein n=1 Tax=Lutimaribacter degradans TaxID=2945989 RepID=A0ACC5ZUB7_9RHOB|nr:VOC family protein [Lutimaribacter sp. EGI FJ00013]MCM2561543.1 VOC family protein [Lutimaribacter sp. EGI FJ00013]MCO0612746.1 VOC family protein [Lutimaribacter sp. EGI FJ00015]MCO0635404.1 VOC family protein [Lutimaribacter sp. EGI FJ00014]
MLTQINGLHHVTSLASDAQQNNDFFTKTLGLRRVKKTVNFDAPEVYHLYYGDEIGTPGTVMTYFPFPGARRGRPGAGEVAVTAFSIPKGSRDWWANRLAAQGVQNIISQDQLGEVRLRFDGPDGDGFALVETDDARAPWTGGDIGADHAIRGFHSTQMRLADQGATAELLRFMGYEQRGTEGDITRFAIAGGPGNGANVIDIETLPNAPAAAQGAGSVHHIAFSVNDRAAQAEVRKALIDTGFQVTPVIDRDYFWAIYFRAPGGVLFEVATNEPGFDRDEDRAHLGEALKLPDQHAHLRAVLEAEHLPPIHD